MKVLIYFLFFLSIFSANLSTQTYKTPTQIAVETVLSSQSVGFLSGIYDVTVEFKEPTSSGSSVSTYDGKYLFENIEISNGLLSFVLGDGSRIQSESTQDCLERYSDQYGDGKYAKCNVIHPDLLLTFNQPMISISLTEQSTGIEFDSIEIPLFSVPYAVQSAISETALFVSANNVVGAFTSPVNVQSDLNVYSSSSESPFFSVDVLNKSVGIGTSNSSYTLNVDGSINASEYFINDKNIESYFSWNKNQENGTITYTDGVVGIGTSAPKFASRYGNEPILLDVAGTINAKQYYIKEYPIEQHFSRYFSWKLTNDGDNLYFDGGNKSLGIGVSRNLVEQLVVSGAIRIGKAVGERAGTIEYDSDEKDFFGFFENGTKYSLSGVRIDPQLDHRDHTNELLYWRNSKEVTSTENLVFLNGNLGIGTSTPTSLLTITGDGSKDYFKINNSTNLDTLFVVNASGNIGVGKTSPTYSFDVNGIVDAQGFFLDGSPLSEALSAGSYWVQQNTTVFGTDIAYNRGNVGIGTSSPVNLLEISSDEDNAAITFDILGNDYFSIGVKESKPNTFIISKGSDLNQPVFVVSNNMLGIGTDSPVVNLHISGNSGLLVEGAHNPNADFGVSGSGSKMFFYTGKSAFRAGRILGQQWDKDNIGLYSVAMGYTNMAKGDFSAIMGGGKNTVLGNYSVVPGGLENSIDENAHHSFAAGYYANVAHSGSFVWSDITSSANVFSTTADNQFLIRAFGGVGINTNETSEASLTIENNLENGHLMLLQGRDDSDRILFANDGSLFLGSDDVPNQYSSRMHVNGRVGIGTVKPEALLHVNRSSHDGYLAYISNPDIANSQFVITATGSVGIGTDHPLGMLDVSGNIFAQAFYFLNPDGSIEKLQTYPGSPWAPSDDLGNTYYSNLNGFVGIGTPSPNSILELGDIIDPLGEQRLPLITFDYEGEDKYVMGLAKNSEQDIYFMIHTTANVGDEDPFFVITSESVVLGRGLVTSDVLLDVSGNMIVDGGVYIATTNVGNSGYDLVVDGPVNFVSLNIRGVPFQPFDPSDPESPPVIWNNVNYNGNVYGNYAYTTKNLLINVDPQNLNPRFFDSSRADFIDVSLYVNGSMAVSTLNTYSDIVIDNDLITNKIIFYDEQPKDDIPTASLNVINGNLNYCRNTSGCKALNSLLSLDSNVTSGPLAAFVNDNTIAQTNVFWDSENSSMSVSGNFVVNNFLRKTNGINVSSNLSFSTDIPFKTTSIINNYGLPREVTNFTQKKIELNIEQDWGNINGAEIVGLDLDINSSGTIYNNNSVIGLRVSVTDNIVNLVDQSRNYAAVFLGGNVGIGTSKPNYMLEVNGVVSANRLNLSETLTIPSLVIDSPVKGFIASGQVCMDSQGCVGRVGIGTLYPSAELEVVGAISANRLTVDQASLADTINVANGAFQVTDNGRVGFGRVFDNSRFSLYDHLSLLETNHTTQKVFVEFDGSNLLTSQALAENTEFYFSNDYTLMDISVDFDTNTVLSDSAELIGLNFDFGSLKMKKGTKLIGLNIDVSDDGDQDEAVRYAAIFNGGNVGINTDNPEYALDVLGTIRANELILLDQSIAFPTLSVGNLHVESSATLNVVSINTLTVKGSLNVATLNFLGDLSAPNGFFESILVSSDIVVDGTLYANQLSVNNVSMIKDIVVTNITVNEVLRGQSFISESTVSANSLNIGQGVLFVSSNGAIGFNVNKNRLSGSKMDFNLNHTQSTPVEFDFSDTSSWNALKIGLNNPVLNSSVGLLFVPDQDYSSSNVGSGIVAVNVGDRSSDLVFITDPINDLPKERMRIKSNGYIGINIDNPSYQLHVSGDIKANQMILTTLNIKNIVTDQNEIVFSAVTVNFQSEVSANHFYFNSGIALKPLQNESTIQSFSNLNRGVLYVDSSDNSLRYYKPALPGSSDGESINISAGLSGKPNTLIYFDESGSLADDFDLTVDSSTQTLQLGNVTDDYKFRIASSIDRNQNQGSYNVESIEVNFGNRADLNSNTIFTGFSVEMKSSPNLENAGSSLEVGRLANGETAIGLKVDLTELVFQQNNNIGKKYAATFLGGGVGIGTEVPSALLDIRAQNSSLYNDLLKISKDDTSTIFVVDATGNIGVNIDSPKAALHINGQNSNSEYLFQVDDRNGNASFLIDNNGKVAINRQTIDSNYDLYVSGNLFAQDAVFDSVSANELSVGDFNFKINQNGQISVGTSNVSGAILKVFSDAAQTNTSEIIGQKIEIVIDDPNTGQSNSGSRSNDFNKPLVGIDMSFETGGSYTVSGPATAIDIDFSSLNTVAADSQFKGLVIDMGPENVIKNAAIFKNGKVGIATENPTEALSVSGNIIANGLFIDGDLDLNSVTVNNLFKIKNFGTSEFYGDVKINNNLEVLGNLVVNELTLHDKISITTASFYKSVTVNRLFKTNGKVLVGVDYPTQGYDFEVSGNAKFDGNLAISQQLLLNTISPKTGDIITLSGNMISDGFVSFNNLSISEYLQLNETTNVPNLTNEAQLYFRSGDLMFKAPGLSAVTINSRLSNQSNSIPYIDSSGNLIGSSLQYQNNRLILGDSQRNGQLMIQATISDSNIDYTGQIISLNVSGAGGNRTHKGLFIDLSSADDDSRLGQGETAIGLHVDMSGLGSGAVEPAFFDRKYAAVFEGGAVGIGTTTPQSLLHLKGRVVNDVAEDLLHISSTSTTNMFVVNNVGQVGINVDPQIDSNSLFQIKKVDGIDKIFTVYDSNNTIFDISNDGVGIGYGAVASSDYSLHVIGTANFQMGDRKTFIGGAHLSIGTTELNVSASLVINGATDTDIMRVRKENGDPIFLIDKDGKVGVGVSENYHTFNTNGMVVAMSANGYSPAAYTPIFTNIFSDSVGFMSISDASEYLFLGKKQPDDNYMSMIWKTNGDSDSKKGLVFKNPTNEVMSFDNEGYIGINRTPENYTLDVSGNFRVGFNDNLFIVSENNNNEIRVGVGISQTDYDNYYNIPTSAMLFVNGSLAADKLFIQKEHVTFNTVTVLDKLVMNKFVTNNSSAVSDYAMQVISLNLSQHINNGDIYGLKVRFQSNATNNDDDNFYMLHGGKKAYGLYVDMTDLYVAGEDTDNSSLPFAKYSYGNKYTAVFKGGNVGIGTTLPSYQLHVVGDANSNIAGFGSSQGRLVVRDYQDGRMALNVVDPQSDSVNHIGLVIEKTSSAVSAPANVGIGVRDPDQSLVVAGNVRVGVVSSLINSDALNNESLKWGNKLLFSGGAKLDSGSNSDNEDDLFIARYNEARGQSSLRVNFSGSMSQSESVPLGDKFQVGYTLGSSFKPVFQVDDSGRVLMHAASSSVESGIDGPHATLHVRGTSSDSRSETTDPSSFVTMIENETQSPQNSNILGIKYERDADNISDGINFITFEAGSSTLGAIEGNGYKGIRFKTVGADYAEYLERLNSDELIEKGDIVGIFNGKISKVTKGAQQIMVISSGAAVAGNMPTENENNFELVSFFGQVKTKVKGNVRKGDFILPSDENDGVGVAISPDMLPLHERNKIVGRAWEDSDSMGVSYVNIAVGFAFGSFSVSNDLKMVQELEQTVSSLSEKQEALLDHYRQTLNDQNEKINDLIQQLENKLNN